jgi:hypothetical protein
VYIYLAGAGGAGCQVGILPPGLVLCVITHRKGIWHAVYSADLTWRCWQALSV